MIEFKFDVLAEEIEGVSLRVGDAVIPVKQTKILPGGYEYDTWRKVFDGTCVDVLASKRPMFVECMVAGYDEAEVMALVRRTCEEVRQHGRPQQ